MDIRQDILDSYIQAHCSAEPEVLARLSRETHLKTFMPQMLTGNVTGQFLKMISMILRPVSILEIGTFTGYSAICLAQGLARGGKLITIEKNPQMADFAASYLKKTEFYDRINVVRGNALEMIGKLDEKFDLVFIDGDKEEYCDYFELLETRLNNNAVVLIDNTLWYGKVADAVFTDKTTGALRRFNDLIALNKNFDVVMLSVGDGITMARKRS